MWMMITQVKYSYPCLIPPKGCWEHLSDTFLYLKVWCLVVHAHFIFNNWSKHFTASLLSLILAFDDMMVSEEANFCLICWYFSWTRTVWGHLMTMNLFDNLCPVVSLNNHSWVLNVRLDWYFDQRKSGRDDLEIFKLNRPNHMSLSIVRLICMPIIPLNWAIWFLFLSLFNYTWILFLYFNLQLGVDVVMMWNKLPLLKELRTLAGRIEPINPIATTE